MGCDIHAFVEIKIDDPRINPHVWDEKRDQFVMHAPIARNSELRRAPVRESVILAREWGNEMMTMLYGPRPGGNDDAE